jgi:hypothetical protein
VLWLLLLLELLLLVQHLHLCFNRIVLKVVGLMEQELLVRLAYLIFMRDFTMVGL